MEAETPRRSHRLRNWAIGLAAAYAIHVVLLGVVAPRVAHEPLRKLIADAIAGEVEFEEFSFNPFTLTIEAREFTLRDGDGRVVATAEQALANIEFWASLLGVIEIGELQLDSPIVHVEIDENGRLNLLDLLAHELELEHEDEQDEADLTDEVRADQAQQEETGLFLVRVAQAKLSAGQIVFVDRARAHSFEAAIIPLELTLFGFSTVPGERGRLHLEASGSRGSHLSTDFTLSLDPLSATGQMSLAGVSHALLADYLGLDAIVRPLRGEFSLQGGFRAEISDAGVVLEIDEGRVDADGWEIESDLASLASVGFERFSMAGLRLALTDRSIRIDEIVIDALQVAAVLPGRPARATDEGSSSTEPGDAGWTVQIGRVALLQGRVTLAHATGRETPFLHLGPLSLDVQDLSNEVGHPFDLDLKLGVPEIAGQPAEPGGPSLISVQGEISLNPMAARIDVEAKRVALAPFGELMPLAPGVRIESGTLHATSSIEASVPEGAAPSFSATTDLALHDLEVVDSRHAGNGNGRERQAVGLGLLELRRLRIRENGSHLELAGLRLVSPRLRIERSANGALNLAKLFVQDEPAGGPHQTEAPDRVIGIRQIQIEDGRVEYRDATTTRPFSLDIEQVAGEIERKVDREDGSQGIIRLTGKLDGTSPVTIDGTFPSPQQLAFRMRVDGLAATHLSPYFEQYVGNGIEQGKLYLDLDYEIDDRTVAGHNEVRFDGLAFGPRTDSPDKLNLPIPLAFKLMTDSKGQTEFDLDIVGHLGDPGFSPRSLITEAFIKVIRQSLSSPLAVLQTAMPDLRSDKQLRFDFAPGNAQLDLDQETQLGALASILASNPKQRVRIKGRVDLETDGAALENQLGDAEDVDEGTIRDLGQARVRVIRDELVERGGISTDRIFVRSVDMKGEAGAEGIAVEVTLTDD